eukprot:4139778-Lingulodinium_polyedra.AAC.1
MGAATPLPPSHHLSKRGRGSETYATSRQHISPGADHPCGARAGGRPPTEEVVRKPKAWPTAGSIEKTPYRRRSLAPPPCFFSRGQHARTCMTMCRPARPMQTHASPRGAT